jgi:hypothetical protein
MQIRRYGASEPLRRGTLAPNSLRVAETMISHNYFGIPARIDLKRAISNNIHNLHDTYQEVLNYTSIQGIPMF